ncbi:MAG: hypothetical protein FWH21_02995 [Kiritimatiellaeota bacterium]|nr:hypothetical protein [Kiritimatiellota bacterium]
MDAADGGPLLMPRPRNLLAAAYGRWLLLILALAPLLPSYAPIFWRSKGRVVDVLTGMGGASVYSTPVQVNGAPGTLSAYAFKGRFISEVTSVLASQLKLPPLPKSPSALLTFQESNRLQRMLVLPSSDGTDSCIVLVFDQSLRDAQRSADAPVAWPEGFASFPGAPRFTAVCANTRTTFATADAVGPPETVAQEAAAVLRGKGWTESPASTPTFKLLSDRNRICAVFASLDPTTGQTTLSIVQRDGSN